MSATQGPGVDAISGEGEGGGDANTSTAGVCVVAAAAPHVLPSSINEIWESPAINKFEKIVNGKSSGQACQEVWWIAVA